MIGIYKITNPNGRVYIGQSVDIERRWIDHKNANDIETPLYRSIKKYGIDNHIFEVVEECEIGKLNRRERYYQEKYNVLENGLNCRLTSTDTKSGKLKEEVKKKISENQKGRKFTDTHRKKLSKSHLGKKVDEQTKLKISSTLKGMKKSIEWQEKITQSLKGKKLGYKNSEETRVKISNSLKSLSLVWIYNPSTKETMRISKKVKIPTGWKKGRGDEFGKSVIKKCVKTSNIIEEYSSIADAEKDGYRGPGIIGVLKGRTKTYPKGLYTWEYKN